ncbi:MULTISPECIES: TetR/AcrR family transcriptional regulator [unclassified Lysinibacillus]|uniref:TetR/AcrR family transcriptional regulator n=1 Tax=unclassified Lysinibacillus TaxID=2636778 RepID=UPI002011F828|nr:MULTISPECIES: TetR/AcrR family transcriptional regulator [unclassified Lysinibacillus]MCL1694541.1 TetR/AcrR family transcriptional regulator [Lysinibacillus sp. BPa_S21]MCL1699374.1 TetR/AcrR family transcriptional regulator [Lysinibacillus sp. Bpr_S20]
MILIRGTDRMAKNFTEEDIPFFKQKLRECCAQSWKTKGYKLTSIDTLTIEVGISTEFFYRLYTTKEELFLEVLSMIQHQLKEQWYSMIQNDSGMEGFKKAMNWLFEEYAKHPTLYNFNNPDYHLFLKKLPKEKIENLRENDKNIFFEVLERSNLEVKISKEKAYGIFSTLLYTAAMKKDLIYNKCEIFNFLLDSSMYQIFGNSTSLANKNPSTYIV